MRLFLAYAIDDTIKNYVHEIQEALKPSLYQGRLTQSLHLHLTVLFLGDQPGHRLSELESILDEVLTLETSFACASGMLGHFKQGPKALVYLGIEEGAKHLKKLHDTVKKALEAYDFVIPKQAYTPHITIARQVTFKDTEQAHFMPQEKQFMAIQSLTLFHSYRHHETLTHEPLAHFDLLESHIKG